MQHYKCSNYRLLRFFQMMTFWNISVPVVEGHVLNLVKVSRLDMGAYMCIASNGVPPAVSKRIQLGIDCKLLLTVSHIKTSRGLWNHFKFMSIFSVPPMMWVPAQQISAVRGAPRAKLTCFVEAHPEALTFWEKDRRMIQQGGRFRMSSHRGTPSYKVSQIVRA